MYWSDGDEEIQDTQDLSSHHGYFAYSQENQKKKKINNMAFNNTK